MEQEHSLLGVKTLLHMLLALRTRVQGTWVWGSSLLLISYVIPSNALGCRGCTHKIGIMTTQLPELHKVFSYFGDLVCGFLILKFV